MPNSFGVISIAPCLSASNRRSHNDVVKAKLIGERRLRRLCAPQKSTQSCQKLADGKRLGHVIIGPKIESENTIRLFAPRREHQYRRSETFSAQPAANLQATHLRKHQIENHKVGFLSNANDNVSPSVAVTTSSVPLEYLSGLKDRRIVLDDQHQTHGAPAINGKMD
jgi:hypothetical protein